MEHELIEELNRYAEKFSDAGSSLLQKIERETNLETEQPHMLSGQVQGRFLSLISQLIQPNTILEIGTFTGYSALCMAEGLAENGILHTIDINDERAERCKNYFKEAGMEDKIILHSGDATDILPRLPGPFELVYIDADKPNYENYFDLVLNKVPVGGLIIADNTLYHGEILQPRAEQGKNAKGITDFNNKVIQSDTVTPIMLNLRDGLYIIRKNKEA